MAPTELVLTSITDVGFAPCALPCAKVKNVGNTRLTAAQGDKAQCRDFEGDKLDGPGLKEFVLGRQIHCW